MSQVRSCVKIRAARRIPLAILFLEITMDLVVRVRCVGLRKTNVCIMNSMIYDLMKTVELVRDNVLMAGLRTVQPALRVIFLKSLTEFTILHLLTLN